MRKKEGNKELDILNAAIKIFAKSGYFKAKVSKIAETANISVGSIYVYYKSKDEILYRIFDNIWGGLFDKFNSVVLRDDMLLIEKYDAMIDMIFDTFTENTSTAIVLVQEQQRLLLRNPKKFTVYYEKFVELGEEIVKEGIKIGEFNSEIDVKIFRHFLLGAFRDLINSWATNKKDFPLNLLRENIKYISKYGLLVHK